MWLDQHLVLCDKTDFFGSAATKFIGDIIDLGQFDSGKPKLSGSVPATDNITANPNFGGLMPMTMLFRVTEAMAGGTSVDFQLYSANTLNGNRDGLGSGIGLHWRTGGFAPSDVTRGRELIVPLPHDSAVPYKRYAQMAVTLVGDSTAGEVSAMLLVGAHQWEAMHGNYVQV